MACVNLRHGMAGERHAMCESAFSVHLYYGKEFLTILSSTLKMNTFNYFIYLRFEFRLC
jgi:hypothetical protein